MKASLGAATTRRRTIGLIISRTERPDGDDAAAALGTVPVSREAGARHCASPPASRLCARALCCCRGISIAYGKPRVSKTEKCPAGLFP